MSLSILDKLRRKKNPRVLNYYNGVVRRNREDKLKQLQFEEENAKLHNIKVIEENERRVRDALIEKNKHLKKAMEMPKEEDSKKDIDIIQNVTLNSMISGFLTSISKEKYIKSNRSNFKNLNIQEQQVLFKLFASYI